MGHRVMRLEPDDADSAHRAYAETRDPGLESWLLRHHEPLAMLLARRFSHRGEPADDLRQVALLAMLRALRAGGPLCGAKCLVE
jgi:DNA-directed RNA polymerase specialized sigma subunit